MAITVRYPKIDYSKIRAHWSPNIAFAQDRNAMSTIPTPIEPWLIRILQTAIPKLPKDDPQLLEDVKAFIAQESQHFRQHRLFNKVMVDLGYPKLAEYEKELVDELEVFLNTRSLKFLLAYAEGFEAMGAVAGEVWFEKSDAFLEGADENAAALWKWHMAEEFEHREVCFKLFHAMYSRGFWNKIVNGYFYRVYGFVFAMKHLGGYGKKVGNYMLEVDRSKMTEAEKEKLKVDIKTFNTFQRRHFLRPLLKNFLPWYDPGKKRVPRGLVEYLRRFEPGGDYARPSRDTVAEAK